MKASMINGRLRVSVKDRDIRVLNRVLEGEKLPESHCWLEFEVGRNSGRLVDMSMNLAEANRDAVQRLAWEAYDRYEEKCQPQPKASTTPGTARRRQREEYDMTMGS